MIDLSNHVSMTRRVLIAAGFDVLDVSGYENVLPDGPVAVKVQIKKSDGSIWRHGIKFKDDSPRMVASLILSQAAEEVNE